MPSEQLRALIEMFREMPLFTGDLAADRAAMGGTGPGVPSDFPHELIEVGGRPAIWGAAPGADESAAILYLHGGGYVMGGIDTHAGFAARLATECGTRILLLDYRLGPEHHHPAALDDAVAAWRWLTGEAGIAASRTIVAGDSAGGGLTVATLTALRDDGARPAAAVAISPWADLTCTFPSHHQVGAADPLVNTAALATYAAAYAGDTPLDDPRLSPVHGDLGDLAPLLIQVGDLEVLLDDSRVLAERIGRAGGRAVLQEWTGAPHVFPMMGAPESDEAIAAIAAWVRTHLG